MFDFKIEFYIPVLQKKTSDFTTTGPIKKYGVCDSEIVCSTYSYYLYTRKHNLLYTYNVAVEQYKYKTLQNAFEC